MKPCPSVAVNDGQRHILQLDHYDTSDLPFVVYLSIFQFVVTDREIEIPFPTIQRNTNIYIKIRAVSRLKYLIAINRMIVHS